MLLKTPLIDPNDVENFNRTEREKEAFFLFTIFVAGKTARVMCQKSHAFHESLLRYMNNNRPDLIPTESDGALKNLDKIPLDYIMASLENNKIGKYGVLEKLFRELQENPIDIESVTIEQIEKLPGIGKKTSRYFMLYTFRNHPEMAILDRHVLTYLRNLGYDVPLSTPSGKLYDRIEKIFLEEYHKSDFKGSLTEFDLAIWKNKGNLPI